MKHKVSREEFEQVLHDIIGSWITVLPCSEYRGLKKKLECLIESGKNTQYRVVAFGVDYIYTYDAHEALEVYNSIEG